MIEVHLYGKLHHYAPCSKASGESLMWIRPRPGDTVATVLRRAGIPAEDVYHVFLKGAILSTRNSMAPWLEHEQAERSSIDRPTVGRSRVGEELEPCLHDRDRLGLFARELALLVV